MMLSKIKNIIRQKMEFLESAETLYEDFSDPIDDVFLEDDDEEDLEIPDNVDGVEDEAKDDDKGILDAPIDGDDDNDEEDVKPQANENTVTGTLDPEEKEDLLSVTINLASETITDVLPATPVAHKTDEGDGEAMGESFGFLLEPLDEPFVDEKRESDDLFSEAIELGSDSPDTKDTDKSDEPKDDEKKGEDETEVTKAVKDRISEEDDASGPEGLEDSGETASVDRMTIDGTKRQEILDRLDKLHKQILDAKEAIKKQITPETPEE